MGTMHDCVVKGCTEVTPPGKDRLPDEWGLVTYTQERMRGSGVVYLCPVHLKRVCSGLSLSTGSLPEPGHSGAARPN